MPLTLHVEIVSAETQIFSGIAHMAIAPAVHDDLGILPRHAPLLARLKRGLVRVVIDGETEEAIFVSGGFIEVQPYLVTILADTAQRSKDLDEAAARATKELLEKEFGWKAPASRGLHPIEGRARSGHRNYSIHRTTAQAKGRSLSAVARNNPAHRSKMRGCRGASNRPGYVCAAASLRSSILFDIYQGMDAATDVGSHRIEHRAEAIM